MIHVAHRSAEDLLRAAGHRVTRARVRVLTELLRAHHPLSHQELADTLEPSEHIDRVTLYRVLEWLTGNHLAHRVLGEDRVWRYGMQPAESQHHHAHFKCNDCGQVFCLDELSTAFAVNVPSGYQASEIELTIKGRCAVCRTH
jgi:Fur family transcriptional regulator, ferric uptake regulator